MIADISWSELPIETQLSLILLSLLIAALIATALVFWVVVIWSVWRR